MTNRLQAVLVDGVTFAPNRHAIRAYVTAKVGEVRAFAAGGGNPHHLLLDHQDQLDRFASTLPDDTRAEFLRIYTEEMRAATIAVQEEVAAKEQAITAGSNRVWLLLVVGLIVVLPILMQQC